MKKINNIAGVEIQFNANETKYFFPESVPFNGKTINNIFFAPGITPPSGNTPVQSVDGIFLVLKNKNKQNVLRNISANYFCRNGFQQTGIYCPLIDLDDVIDFQNSYIYTNNSNLAGKSIMAYFVYDNCTCEDEELPSNNITVSIPDLTGPGKILLSDYIDETILQSGQTVKSIQLMATAIGSVPSQNVNWDIKLTLRDALGRVFDYVPNNLIGYFDNWNKPVRLNDFCVDFRNSHLFFGSAQYSNINLIIFY